MTISSQTDIRLATTREEIAPLIELCRTGHLFEVQAWIASGKPINPPLKLKGNSFKGPLAVAIDRGFHSLVEVLLKAGAIQHPAGGYSSPMYRALEMRRLDILELLVEHGADPRTIDMADVFRSWDPATFDFFIKHGADLMKGSPFTRAFCERIRTALAPFKKILPQRPELQEQANIALRHHCKEGDVKWISLLLWAGAD